MLEPSYCLNYDKFAVIAICNSTKKKYDALPLAY